MFDSAVWASCLHPKCEGLSSKVGLLDWVNNLLKNNSREINLILVLKLLLNNIITKLLPSFNFKLSS